MILRLSTRTLPVIPFAEPTEIRNKPDDEMLTTGAGLLVGTLYKNASEPL